MDILDQNNNVVATCHGQLKPIARSENMAKNQTNEETIHYNGTTADENLTTDVPQITNNTTNTQNEKMYNINTDNVVVREGKRLFDTVVNTIKPSVNYVKDTTVAVATKTGPAVSTIQSGIGRNLGANTVGEKLGILKRSENYDQIRAQQKQEQIKKIDERINRKLKNVTDEVNTLKEYKEKLINN